MITFTLLSEGSSDRVLLPLLKWLIRQHRPDSPIEDQFADLRYLHRPPDSLTEKIVFGIQLYPCHILFIHKDMDKATYVERQREILDAFQRASEALSDDSIPSIVCVVPKRMQEAWLLFDENAIRVASGNPNGQVRLNLPVLRELEDIPDPKHLLHNLLKRASEFHGRRLKDFNPAKQAHLITEHIIDFSPLRQLPAFQIFERDLATLIEQYF